MEILFFKVGREITGCQEPFIALVLDMKFHKVKFSSYKIFLRIIFTGGLNEINVKTIAKFNYQLDILNTSCSLTRNVCLFGKEQVHLDILPGILINTDVSSCEIITPPLVFLCLSHSSENRFYQAHSAL